MDRKNSYLLLIVGMILTIVFVTVAGCTGSNGSTATTTPTPAPAATPTPKIVLSVVPSENATSTINAFTPLKDYIHNVTGYDIQLYVATDYTGVITAMQSKHVDVAFFGPLSYAMATTRADAVAFAEGYNTYNRSFYYSYMLATPEVASALGITSSLQGADGMKTLKTLLDAHKGQYTYSFVDPASTSGYGIPRAAMAMAGIDPAVEFKKTGFAGGHDADALAVKQKTADMASCQISTYDKLIASGQITPQTDVIIWTSDPIPESPFAYRNDLAQDVKDNIKNAILSAPADVLKPAGYNKFVAADDSVYTQIKALQAQLEALPA